MPKKVVLTVAKNPQGDNVFVYENMSFPSVNFHILSESIQRRNNSFLVSLSRGDKIVAKYHLGTAELSIDDPRDPDTVYKSSDIDDPTIDEIMVRLEDSFNSSVAGNDCPKVLTTEMIARQFQPGDQLSFQERTPGFFIKNKIAHDDENRWGNSSMPHVAPQ